MMSLLGTMIMVLLNCFNGISVSSILYRQRWIDGCYYKLKSTVTHSSMLFFNTISNPINDFVSFVIMSNAKNAENNSVRSRREDFNFMVYSMSCICFTGNNL